MIDREALEIVSIVWGSAAAFAALLYLALAVITLLVGSED